MHSGDKGTRFYPADELRKETAAVDIDPEKDAITYCDTGMFGSLGWFALHELLGDQQSALYVGAMNEWAADPARPVTTFTQE